MVTRGRSRTRLEDLDAMPGYGLEKTGHIALQDHGDEVAFRSIRIRELALQ